MNVAALPTTDIDSDQ